MCTDNLRVCYHDQFLNWNGKSSLGNSLYRYHLDGENERIHKVIERDNHKNGEPVRKNSFASMWKALLLTCIKWRHYKCITETVQLTPGACL